MKALIVDDNIENIDMMTIMLKSQNFEVEPASNGKEALEKLHSNNFDLIISDILMPVMDGFQFCRECKKDERLKNIYFIFYTATYVDKKDEELAISLGAQKFIRKPQEPEVFLRLINEVIGKSENIKDAKIMHIEHDEKEIFKLYNERLVKKLEKKNHDLQKEIISHRETEKKLIEAKEKAEESDRLKSAFLTNISHEVRTPMNGIIGFINLLKEPGIDKFKQDQYLETIEKSCNQLLSIITDIVEISNIEAKHIKVNNGPTNIPVIINDLYTHFSNNAQSNKNIYIKKPEIFLDDKYICVTDEVKLIQILANLVENAIKYTTEGTVEFGFKLNGSDEIEFYVKDTGIGIDKKYHELIFERFRQLETSLSLHPEGTGLGLSISREFVQLLGGKIWLNSEPGKGSEFYFTIPYKPVANKDLSNKISTTGSCENILSDKVILIAEDDDFNYIYLAEILLKYDVRILRAYNGKEAIQYCKTNPDIDIVLMDIKMPVIDGYEATKQILNFRNNIPVIMQTAYTFSNDMQKALDYGCVDYISKPINKDKLINILCKHLI